MADTKYGDISPRTAAYVVKELLKRAIPFMCIEKFGQAKPLPTQSTKSMVFRRYNALPTTPTALVEGVTPGSATLSSTDVTMTLVQYGNLITISDIITDTHEDDVLRESIDLLGEQAAQMVEGIRFGVLKAGTNVVYANGATRSAVNTVFSLSAQRRVTKALKRQNATQITRVVRSTPSFNTEAVAKSFIALCHPDVEPDLRNTLGADGRLVFVSTERYGALPQYENEIGKIEDCRYLTSTIFSAWPDAGGAKGTTASTTGVNSDVYPIIYLGQNAYAISALKGMYAVTPMVVNAKPSDSDPMAQRSKVSFKTMQGCVILNDQWMCRLEVAVSA